MLKLVWSIIYHMLLVLVALVVMEIMLGHAHMFPHLVCWSGLSYTSCSKATNALSKSMLSLSFTLFSLSLSLSLTHAHTHTRNIGERKSHLYAYKNL